jgi:hypothetical protein
MGSQAAKLDIDNQAISKPKCGQRKKKNEGRREEGKREKKEWQGKAGKVSETQSPCAFGRGEKEVSGDER